MTHETPSTFLSEKAEAATWKTVLRILSTAVKDPKRRTRSWTRIIEGGETSVGLGPGGPAPQHSPRRAPHLQDKPLQRPYGDHNGLIFRPGLGPRAKS